MAAGCVQPRFPVPRSRFPSLSDPAERGYVVREHKASILIAEPILHDLGEYVSVVPRALQNITVLQVLARQAWPVERVDPPAGDVPPHDEHRVPAPVIGTTSGVLSHVAAEL